MSITKDLCDEIDALREEIMELKEKLTEAEERAELAEQKLDEMDAGDHCEYLDRIDLINAELATIRTENDLLRSIIQRAKAQVPSSVWTWHEDANEALK